MGRGTILSANLVEVCFVKLYTVSDGNSSLRLEFNAICVCEIIMYTGCMYIKYLDRLKECILFTKTKNKFHTNILPEMSSFWVYLKDYSQI
jgi:hypothetical protein